MLERMVRYAAEALGKSFRVAVLATRADLGTAANGVPRGVSPLDGAAIAHEMSPLNPIGECKAKIETQSTATAIAQNGRTAFRNGAPLRLICPNYPSRDFATVSRCTGALPKFASPASARRWNRCMSCSQVKPIPPCTCIASEVTFFAMSEAYAFAIGTAVAVSAVFSSTVQHA